MAVRTAAISRWFQNPMVFAIIVVVSQFADALTVLSMPEAGQPRAKWIGRRAIRVDASDGCTCVLP